MEPTAYTYAKRYDNVEAIYKKLSEQQDTADVAELLKELHRIINEAIRTNTTGEDQAEGLTFDPSQIDLERLRDEFAKKVRRKATAIQDIRDIVQQKLAQMRARNPIRMDYRMRLPTRRLDDGLDRAAIWRSQQSEHPSLLGISTSA